MSVTSTLPCSLLIFNIIPTPAVIDCCVSGLFRRKHSADSVGGGVLRIGPGETVCSGARIAIVDQRNHQEIQNDNHAGPKHHQRHGVDLCATEGPIRNAGPGFLRFFPRNKLTPFPRFELFEQTRTKTGRPVFFVMKSATPCGWGLGSGRRLPATELQQ